MVSSGKVFQRMAGFFLLIIVGCSDSSPDPVFEDPVTDQPGFAGKVSGAVSGEISGPGVATYLPSRDRISGMRSGYFLIANGRGVKELMISFRIPARTEPGTYQLVPPDPMEVGNNFEVRLESQVDGKLVSYGLQTEGTLTLELFPNDGEKLSGTKIKGSFQFVTQNSEKESLSASGTFEFFG